MILAQAFGAVDCTSDLEYVAHNRPDLYDIRFLPASRPTRSALTPKECDMAKTPEKKPSMVSEIDLEQIVELIRRRAFELYEARGFEHCHDLDDWLHAEEEVIQAKARSMAA